MKSARLIALPLLALALVGCGPDDDLDSDSEFEESGAAAPDITGQTTPPVVPPPPGQPLEVDSSEVILER